jgi:hypothetical protein
MTPVTYKGIVRGKTIELEDSPGLPDGKQVTGTMQASDPDVQEKLPPGEGIRRSAGAWKDDDPEGLDRYLEWCRQQRQGREPIAE